MNTKKSILFSKLICFFIFKLVLFYSAATNGQAGARSKALAESTVADYGFWAIGGNPAGLSTQNILEAGVAIENRFLIKELQGTELAVAYGGKLGSIAASLSRFGFSLYSENRFGLMYSRKLQEKLSIGIELHYQTLAIGEAKDKTRSGDFNLGLIYEISSRVKIGFHAGNPGSFLFSNTTKNHETAFFRLGMGFEASENLRVLWETNKTIDQKPLWKCGLEIIPCEKFIIRTGLSVPPLSISFGSGFIIHRLHIDIASSYHYLLGFSPCLSIHYSLSK